MNTGNQERELEPVDQPLRLDLACGQHKREGFQGVDLVRTAAADIVHDLETYPWPFDDESVDEAFVSHYVEHIPMYRSDGKDGLILFMNELHRILKLNARATIICPYYNSVRAWQDPTHRRAISEQTFLYFNQQWLKANGLSHYPVTANFNLSYAYSLDPEWQTKSEEARNFAIKFYHGVITELHMTLVKI